MKLLFLLFTCFVCYCFFISHSESINYLSLIYGSYISTDNNELMMVCFNFKWVKCYWLYKLSCKRLFGICWYDFFIFFGLMVGVKFRKVLFDNPLLNSMVATCQQTWSRNKILVTEKKKKVLKVYKNCFQARYLMCPIGHSPQRHIK